MYFTEEHEVFRESFKDFLQKEVVPHIDKWEKTGNIDRFIWRKFGDMGYFGLSYPEEYGGLNLDIFYMVIFLEELQKINSGGFAAAIWAHVYLAMTHVNAEGDARIKNKYLSASISGEKIGCLCITEPFGGSDVAGMRTTAIRKENSYVINGSKTFITNGVYSDYLIVAAKTDPSSKHAAFGKTLDSFQALRHKIAEMASQVEMCKEFNYSIAKRLNDGVYVVKEATMSKLISTKMADEVIYDALQLLGGYGYMEEYPMARLLRDSRLGPIGGGTSEILREIIAKIIIDKKEYKSVT